MSSSSSTKKTETTNIREDFVFSNTGEGDPINTGKDNTVTITGTDGETAVAALEEGRKFGEKAFAEAFGFGQEALDFTSDSFDRSATLAGDAISEAFDGIENIVRNSARSVDRSLQVAQSSQTDDSAETLQSLFKWGALGVGAIALAAMVTRG